MWKLKKYKRGEPPVDDKNDSGLQKTVVVNLPNGLIL